MKTAVLMKDGEVLVEQVEVAGSLWERMKGLLGRAGLGRGRGMYLEPCGSIHTFFMAFPLDVIFVDRGLKVVRLVRNVKPGRMAVGGAGARGVLEMEAGWFPEEGLKPGDVVTLSERAFRA